MLLSFEGDVAGTPLGPLVARLRELRVVEPRLLGELFRDDAVSVVCEFVGVDPVNLEPELAEMVVAFSAGVHRLARLEVRRLAAQPRPGLEDTLLVFKRQRAEETLAEKRFVLPLPGKFNCVRRVRRRGGHDTMKARDVEARSKWEERLLAVFVEMGAPVIADISGSDYPNRFLSSIIGGTRPSTLSVRVRAWECFIRWLSVQKGKGHVEKYTDIVDYLHAQVGIGAPVTVVDRLMGALSWISSRAGDELLTVIVSDPRIKRAADWAIVELTDDSKVRRKAPRIPIAVVLALELYVVESRHPLVLRVFAWMRLLKVYGSMRWDDLQRMRPSNVDLRDIGFVGKLTRTKTTGAGRKVRELPVFVPVEATLSGMPWCAVGYGIWEKYRIKQADFFLLRPAVSYEHFGVKAADSVDATAMGVTLFTLLRVPRKISEEAGRSGGRSQMSRCWLDVSLKVGQTTPSAQWWSAHWRRSAWTRAGGTCLVDGPRTAPTITSALIAQLSASSWVSL